MPVAGLARYRPVFGGPSVRRSVAVWILFGIPCVFLSRLGWVDSAVWWLMLGAISLLIAAVTVRIVLWLWRGDRGHLVSPGPDTEATGTVLTPDSRAGPALVASTTTWAIAWLLILSTLAPEHTAARSALDTGWTLVGLAILGIAVTAMCGAVSAILGRGARGASWIWSTLTGTATSRISVAGPRRSPFGHHPVGDGDHRLAVAPDPGDAAGISLRRLVALIRPGPTRARRPTASANQDETLARMPANGAPGPRILPALYGAIVREGHTGRRRGRLRPA